jgi:hypothetical protein
VHLLAAEDAPIGNKQCCQSAAHGVADDATHGCWRLAFWIEVLETSCRFALDYVSPFGKQHGTSR